MPPGTRAPWPQKKVSSQKVRVLGGGLQAEQPKPTAKTEKATRVPCNGSAHEEAKLSIGGAKKAPAKGRKVAFDDGAMPDNEEFARLWRHSFYRDSLWALRRSSLRAARCPWWVRVPALCRSKASTPGGVEQLRLG